MPPTRICKICFKEIEEKSLNSAVNHGYFLCDDCYRKLTPKFHKFKTGKVDCYSIYDYDEGLKGLIYQFKGCFDFELKDIFLDRFKNELKLYFNDYTIIPAPSFIDDDRRRGFNHVLEIYKTLGLKVDQRIIKTQKVKQSDRNAKERGNIGDFLALTSTESLKKTNVLLVDDIYTTGSTIKSCIELLKPLKPRKIKVLVICKTLANNNTKKANTN